MSSPIEEDRELIGRKRSMSESEHIIHENQNKTRTNSKEPRGDNTKTHMANLKNAEKSHTHITNEIYVSLVNEMMFPRGSIGLYGFDHEKGQLPYEQVSSLGYLMSPLRRRTVMEKWSPYEISVFEGAISMYGKNFSTIQKYVETKSVKEIVEFYYEWKMTPHYKEWKKTFIPDYRDFQQ